MKQKSQKYSFCPKTKAFKALLAALTHEQTWQTLFLWRNQVFCLKFFKISQKNVAWPKKWTHRQQWNICPQNFFCFFRFFDQQKENMPSSSKQFLRHKNSEKFRKGLGFAQKHYIQGFVDSFDTWTNMANIVPMKKF